MVQSIAEHSPEQAFGGAVGSFRATEPAFEGGRRRDYRMLLSGTSSASFGARRAQPGASKLVLGHAY